MAKKKKRGPRGGKAVFKKGTVAGGGKAPSASMFLREAGQHDPKTK